ncbi:MAG: type II secretion system protein, partial [Planctomycetota bacterium]
MCANRRADFAAGRRGFTLIELLVVIAIIALLVSILMPMLKQAGEMAQSSACQTNMHSLSNAFHMYASEWDDKLPDDYAYYKNASNPRRVYGLQFWPIIYQYLTDHPERKEGNLGFVHGLRNKVGYLACPSLGEQGGG